MKIYPDTIIGFLNPGKCANACRVDTTKENADPIFAGSDRG